MKQTNQYKHEFVSHWNAYLLGYNQDISSSTHMLYSNYSSIMLNLYFIHGSVNVARLQYLC